MDITSISSLYGNTGVVSSSSSSSDSEFGSVLSGVMELISDTNTLQNQASAEEISFALGESDNVHDLLVAEQKANLAIQYTAAIRNQFITGYNTIMNMQI